MILVRAKGSGMIERRKSFASRFIFIHFSFLLSFFIYLFYPYQVRGRVYMIANIYA